MVITIAEKIMASSDCSQEVHCLLQPLCTCYTDGQGHLKDMAGENHIHEGSGPLFMGLTTSSEVLSSMPLAQDKTWG